LRGRTARRGETERGGVEAERAGMRRRKKRVERN
jgi:hypothetical protein